MLVTNLPSLRVPSGSKSELGMIARGMVRERQGSMKDVDHGLRNGINTPAIDKAC